MYMWLLGDLYEVNRVLCKWMRSPKIKPRGSGYAHDTPCCTLFEVCLQFSCGCVWGHRRLRAHTCVSWQHVPISYLRTKKKRFMFVTMMKRKRWRWDSGLNLNSRIIAGHTCVFSFNGLLNTVLVVPKKCCRLDFRHFCAKKCISEKPSNNFHHHI